MVPKSISSKPRDDRLLAGSCLLDNTSTQHSVGNFPENAGSFLGALKISGM